LPAIVLIAIHRPTYRESVLREVLARHTLMPVLIAAEEEQLFAGRCYIGQPHRHLTLGSENRAVMVHDGFYRAHCVDALFWSVARHAGVNGIGVVLSGMLKDGSLGLAAIKEAGGAALVQSPEEAEFPDMPANAIKHDGPIDLIAPLSQLADEIVRLAGTNGAATSSNASPIERGIH
jgi:two-component system chemotaxis response regulator CheB